MRTIATVLAMSSLALGTTAFAQQTVTEVPQGSGVFPTVGQINCLEELGSGRYCAATYECSGGVSGALWDDMANHNGRQAIGANSPVARLLDCTITIDGKAAVRWMTGYRPSGREGELVGLTASADALPPVMRTTGANDGGRSLLHYILERHNLTLTSFAESYYSTCDDVPFRERDGCINAVVDGIVDSALETLGHATDSSLNQCLANTWERYCRWAYDEFLTTNAPLENICEDNLETAKFLVGQKGIREGSSPGGSGGPAGYVLQTAFAVASSAPGVGGRPNIIFGNYNERVANFPCRDLAEQEPSRMGIGVRYCGEGGSQWQGVSDGFVECDNPNEYELTVLE